MANAVDTENPFDCGVVLTATELEGPARAASWRRWVDTGRAPNPTRDMVDGAGFTDSWADDLEQLAGLGATSVLLTLEWATLEPRPRQYDGDAIEFRRQVFETARNLGLEPWACLVDGTLPGWFADDEGGFGDDRSRGLTWPRHVDWIGETFGDQVAGWVPQREPLHNALRQYLFGTAPPGRRDPAAAADAVADAIRAEYEAWRLLAGSAPVATYQTARPVTAAPDDVKAGPLAAGFERLLWHPWLAAITEGQLIVGDHPPRRIDGLRGAFDRVIVQLRPAVQIDGAGRWHHHPANMEPGPTGLVAWPDASAEALHRVVDEVDDRPVIAAGDLADVAEDGSRRPDYQQAILEVAVDAGASGWWQSSPIDGYHYEYGFDLHPGLISYDRAERKEAEKFRRAANSGGRVQRVAG